MYDFSYFHKDEIQEGQEAVYSSAVTSRVLDGTQNGPCFR